MDDIRVRIAPSPTGYAHVGTAYTALLNMAFAKKSNGKFIIRIEDSDLERNIEGSEEKILEALNWLSIKWDEGPVRLSGRLDLYKSKAKELVDKGAAYEDDGAVRFKNPGENVSWVDAVHGEITVPGDQITDFVMRKSNGYPTYNFAVVVDDIDMKISHVIRGEDHVSNTPRQIALYRAFGVEPPVFAHHPWLLSSKKKKLSKRDADVDVMAYKEMGILPDAFVNFLSLLGWSHPKGEEIFARNEFIEKFSLDRIRRSGAVFDLDKLRWMNSEYIKNYPEKALAEKIFEFFGGKYPREKIEQIVPLVKERISTLKEFESLAGFFFEKVQKPSLSEDDNKHIDSALKALENIKDWNLENINSVLMAEIEKEGFKVGKFFMSLRLAVTGKSVTPPINDSLVILGRGETLTRLKN